MLIQFQKIFSFLSKLYRRCPNSLQRSLLEYIPEQIDTGWCIRLQEDIYLKLYQCEAFVLVFSIKQIALIVPDRTLMGDGSSTLLARVVRNKSFWNVRSEERHLFRADKSFVDIFLRPFSTLFVFCQCIYMLKVVICDDCS